MKYSETTVMYSLNMTFLFICKPSWALIYSGRSGLSVKTSEIWILKRLKIARWQPERSVGEQRGLHHQRFCLERSWYFFCGKRPHGQLLCAAFIELFILVPFFLPPLRPVLGLGFDDWKPFGVAVCCVQADLCMLGVHTPILVYCSRAVTLLINHRHFIFTR